jgi:hypothetical protein
MVQVLTVTSPSLQTQYFVKTLHDQKYVDSCSSNISFQNHGPSFGVGPPFAAITASTLLGRISTRCCNIAAGTCFHSATRALVRSGTDVGRLGLAHSRCSNSSQRYLMGLRLGLCAGHSCSSTSISPNHSHSVSLCGLPLHG